MTKDEQIDLARRIHMEALKRFCVEVDASDGDPQSATMNWFRGTLRSIAVGMIAFDLGDEAFSTLCAEAWTGANDAVEDMRRDDKLGDDEQTSQAKRDAPDEHKSIGQVPEPLRTLMSVGAQAFIDQLDAERVKEGGPAFVVAGAVVALVEARLTADTFGLDLHRLDDVVQLALARMREKALPPTAEPDIVESINAAAEQLVFKPGREMAT